MDNLDLLGGSHVWRAEAVADVAPVEASNSQSAKHQSATANVASESANMSDVQQDHSVNTGESLAAVRRRRFHIKKGEEQSRES